MIMPIVEHDNGIPLITTHAHISPPASVRVQKPSSHPLPRPRLCRTMPPRTRKAAFDPEAAGAEHHAQKKARTPPADRILHNAVAKKLRDNFQSWPAVAIDGLP